jgi:hydrogenase maturation factor
MGEHYLVVKSDPVTFTEKRIGWYAVHVNANDVATMGATPRWFLATLLLPENRCDRNMVEEIFQDIIESCKDLNVTLCGGHTEITVGLERPILAGQMIGEVKKDRLVSSANIRTGDTVLLTQGIAIEGTAILASEKTDFLSERVDIELLTNARQFIDNPGISVTQAALLANTVAHVRGMHDPTEGGLATGLWELSKLCGMGIEVDKSKIQVFPETRIICNCFGIDPWGTIASGALLIVVDPGDSQTVIAALEEKQIPCAKIGTITTPEEDVICIDESSRHTIHPFYSDEITKVL